MSQQISLDDFQVQLTKAKVVRVPLVLGETTGFASVDPAALISFINEFDLSTEGVGEIECGWLHNDESLETLVLYDGWTL